MKTTLELPDDLLNEAKAVAFRRRTTLKALVEHALRRELVDEQSDPGSSAAFLIDEDGLPYFSSRRGKVTSEQVYDLSNEEEV